MTGAVEEIPIMEFTRHTASGTYTYVVYQGRCVRRLKWRGRPHYEVVTGVQLQDADKVTRRRVNVNSQVARRLLSKI